MNIGLDSDGNVPRSLLAALSGRRITLCANPEDAHPLQLLSVGWRQVQSSFEALLDELEALPRTPPTRRADVTKPFRDLIYGATELFDIYAQLIPARLALSGVANKKAIREYREVAKRLRSPTAQLCNRFKHAGAQLAFVWAESLVTKVWSARYMVMVHSRGDALVADKEIHAKGKPNSISFAKTLHEQVHALLRVDAHASLLIDSISDDGNAKVSPTYKGALRVGNILRRIVALSPTVLPGESHMYDGVELEEGELRLVRRAAHRIEHPMNISTSSIADGVTRSFPFA